MSQIPQAIPIPMDDETKSAIQRLVSGTRDWELLKRHILERVDFYSMQFWSTKADDSVRMAEIQGGGHALVKLVEDLDAHKVEEKTESP